MPVTTPLDPRSPLDADALRADASLLVPRWPGPLPGVGALMTTRALPAPVAAGVSASLPPWNDFNLGDHVGDDADVVQAHRQALAGVAGARPVWLRQVHGSRVVRLSLEACEGGAGEEAGGRRGPDGADAEASTRQPPALLVDGQRVSMAESPEADGAWSTDPGVVCTVMVADCLPVLLAAPDGRGVAALHAGWRGLAGAGAMQGRGVLESGVEALCRGTGCDPADVQAWLGPCIGPDAFEVGEDVLRGFGVDGAAPSHRFRPQPAQGGAAPGEPAKWLADLPGLARDRLAAMGLRQVAGGAWCTVSDSVRFFSFRRDGRCGRQAACIWLLP